MKKKVIAIILCILFLTGCWDRRELNELGIVLAFGLDKDDETGKIILTSQVVRPGELRKEGGGGEISVAELVSSEGDTIFDAIRNVSKEFDRRAFFSHDKVIIIDESLARDGLLPIIDFIIRSREIRRLTWLVIARNATARELLGVQHGIENIQASYLNNIIKRRSVTSEVTVSNILELLKKIPGKGINPVTGVMELIEQPNFPIEDREEKTTKGVKLSGTGVFNTDKLVGYLNDKETRGFNWVIGKVKSGVIDVPSPVEKNKSITIEISRASSSIEPNIKDGIISFIIKVKEEGDIVGQEGTADITKLEVFEEIEKIQNDTIKKEIEETIDKVQKELGSDIFGFGSALNKKYPKEWEKVKKDWDDIFPEVQYTVEVKGKLRRTGLLLKSIKPDE